MRARAARLASVGLAALWCGAAGSETTMPTPQDMQVVGRILAFQEGHPSGGLTLAIPFATGDLISHSEAEATASLLVGGLTVGNLRLTPLIIAQDQLESGPRFDAVLATTRLDVGALRSALASRRVPCLTLDRSLVERGLCTVAIRSAPTVAITLSSTNAIFLGIRFATAFRMMVTEL